MGRKQLLSRYVPSAIFVFSSIVLLVNNLTQFFQIYKIPFNLNVVSWIAIGISIFWWMFLFGKQNKIW